MMSLRVRKCSHELHSSETATVKDSFTRALLKKRFTLHISSWRREGDEKEGCRTRFL